MHLRPREHECLELISRLGQCSLPMLLKEGEYSSVSLVREYVRVLRVAGLVVNRAALGRPAVYAIADGVTLPPPPDPMKAARPRRTDPPRPAKDAAAAAALRQQAEAIEQIARDLRARADALA